MWYKVRIYQSINTLVNKSSEQSIDQIINQTINQSAVPSTDQCDETLIKYFFQALKC